MGEFKRKLEARRRLARTLTPGERVAFIGGMPTRQVTAIPAAKLIEAGRAAAAKALLKGKFDGNCNRTACQEPIMGANFFNTSTRAYYCGGCADLINEWDLKRGRPMICVPVEDPNDQPSYSDTGAA